MSEVDQMRALKLNAPSSILIKGIRHMPEMSIGIPMTTPENVAVPPKCSAYKLEDETMIKNESWTITTG